MYIESGKIKFYPSAYRQYQDGGETKNINPESELNTEYNITSHISKLLKKSKGSFIVDYVENTNLEFYLGGYYIHITSPQDILNAFPNATQIWANMKVAPFTPTDNTKGFSELYEVVDYEDNNKNIDEINNNVVSFKGVAFLDTKDHTATFSLCLFSRQDTTSSWYAHTSSEYILDTSEIYNENGDTNISSEFYSLKIKTDDLYSELGKIDYATINSNLEVIGDATFETSVEFAGDLLPTSGSQIDIGLSGNPIATVYAENLNVNKITLKSQIIPDGQVNLGSSSSKFNSSYVGTSYVGTLNSVDTEIKVAKDIVPAPYTTLNIGSSTNQLFGVYAQNFYGSLNGNASTATKLNGNNVGGTKNPVYFSNGVPTKSLYDNTLYDRIERESTFQNVVTSNPNTRKFDVYIPSATTSNKVYMNMFALVVINGDQFSFNFVANSHNAGSPNNYSNHILANGVLYRLLINGPWSSSTSVKYSITLQQNNTTSASDEDSGWATMSGGVLQSIVIHYTVR